MKLDEIGETIAARKFTLPNDTGGPSEVVALLGKPRQLPDHTAYYCPYQIKGAGDEKVRYMCGIDELQALQFAIRTLGVELEVLNADLGQKLSWEGDDNGWLGIPDPPDGTSQR